NWDAGGRSLTRESRRRPGCDDHGDLTLDEISRQRRQSFNLISRPAVFDHKVAAFNIAGLAQTPPEAGQPGGVGLRRPEVQISNHRHRLLRTRAERPRSRRAAKQRDELAAFHHSITSSAMARTPGGISRPRAFAVLRLMTKSNFVGCNTGRSAGFSPLRMRPA